MQQLNTKHIEQFLQEHPETKRDEPMAQHTSFRVGGPARLYVTATSLAQLQKLIQTAKQLQIPFEVYGGGSNTLVADEGYEGVVIQMAMRELQIEGSRIIADAGVITGLVARQSVEHGLGGFEWAVGVPGTIGGAVYGNAGCYGGEIKDHLTKVTALNKESGELREFSNTECAFGYRTSCFKSKQWIILQAEFSLPPSQDVQASRDRLAWVMSERKAKQPLGESSAGCAFKNWDYLSDDQLLRLAKEVDQIPSTMKDAKRLSAGWLIQQADLLGVSIGDVAVSEKHGNFMVNKGKAKAADIIALISLVKMKVRDRFGIELEEEVQLLGY